MKENNSTSEKSQLTDNFSDSDNEPSPSSDDHSQQFDDLSLNDNVNLLDARRNPGDLLRSARERLGIPIQKISQQTKINESQIIAIEEGDLDRLPPPTFARAFIKSYCRVLDIDCEPVLMAFGFSTKTKVKAEVPQRVVEQVSKSASDKSVKSSGGKIISAKGKQVTPSVKTIDGHSKAKDVNQAPVKNTASPSSAGQGKKSEIAQKPTPAGAVKSTPAKIAQGLPETEMPGSSKRLSSIQFEKKSKTKKLIFVTLFVTTSLFGYFHGPQLYKDNFVDVSVKESIAGFFDHFTGDELDTPETVEQNAGLDKHSVPPEIKALTDKTETTLKLDNPFAHNDNKALEKTNQQQSSTEKTQNSEQNISLNETRVVESEEQQELFPALKEELAKVDGLASDVSKPEVTNPPIESASTVDQSSNLNAPPLPEPIPPGSSLSFQFEKSAWVTVRDSNDDVLLSKLNAAGSSIEVKGDPPFKLIVGNADSVKLRYNNQPVNLETSARGKIARLTLE